MKRRILLGLAALAVIAGLLLGFRWVKTLSFFQVRRIELVGGTYLTPGDIARGINVPARASIFDDTEPLLARARKIPGVREVRIARRLPGTLRVTIREAEAVALAERGGKLVLVDARGRVLPFDPTHPAADLPLAEADAMVAGVLARVREAEPELFGGILRSSRLRQDVLLEVDGGRLLVRPDVTDLEIRDLALIRQWLAREGTTWRELDGRFSSRVVVRGKGA